jgi:DNA-binding HxlR family transcriptional regulator
VQKDVNSDSLTPAIHLVHRRWSVPVIGTLGVSGPMRFTALLHALNGASRDTLTETLTDLQRAGVIRHDAERAHYCLTPRGERLSEAAVGAVVAVRDNPEFVRVALKKWPMLVLVAIGRGIGRFNALKSALPGITSGALAPALKDLEAADLVERHIADGYPPPVEYRLSEAGQRMFPAMDVLVRAAAEAVRIDGDAAR